MEDWTATYPDNDQLTPERDKSDSVVSSCILLLTAFPYDAACHFPEGDIIRLPTIFQQETSPGSLTVPILPTPILFNRFPKEVSHPQGM
ncbi:hypothetical protein [Niallia endozanthoxylica]|uniref:Uncharacterized protein n=1 Tax=Niallia endozanthoxylica TaxID=2036016 RepID=A0A5J5H2Z2_9BACI|nr:hypothetical protein [Niallia endozanthoxylica]KAA9014900.1 hypothetical protein F4V44_23145 [Niallia endozanthoxylica]